MNEKMGQRWQTSRHDPSQIFPLSQLFYTLTNIWLDGKIIPQGIKNISEGICLENVSEWCWSLPSWRSGSCRSRNYVILNYNYSIRRSSCRPVLLRLSQQPTVFNIILLLPHLLHTGDLQPRNMTTIYHLMIVVCVFNNLYIEKCFVLKTICTFN